MLLGDPCGEGSDRGNYGSDGSIEFDTPAAGELFALDQKIAFSPELVFPPQLRQHRRHPILIVRSKAVDPAMTNPSIGPKGTWDLAP
jgi:hypothetical protein